MKKKNSFILHMVVIILATGLLFVGKSFVSANQIYGESKAIHNICVAVKNMPMLGKEKKTLISGNICTLAKSLETRICGPLTFLNNRCWLLIDARFQITYTSVDMLEGLVTLDFMKKLFDEQSNKGLKL